MSEAELAPHELETRTSSPSPAQGRQHGPGESLMRRSPAAAEVARPVFLERLNHNSLRALVAAASRPWRAFAPRVGEVQWVRKRRSWASSPVAVNRSGERCGVGRYVGALAGFQAARPGPLGQVDQRLGEVAEPRLGHVLDARRAALAPRSLHVGVQPARAEEGVHSAHRALRSALAKGARWGGVRKAARSAR